MRSSPLWKPSLTALCLALMCAAPLAHAQDGYVTSADGKIVRTGFGLCLHSGDWSQDKAVAECDPVQVAQVTPPPTSPVPEPVVAPVHDNLSIDVRFAFDHSDLDAAQRDVLRQGWEQAKADGKAVNVRIVGHTDVEGTVTYNQALSERRAATVASLLESWGADPATIHTEGRGKLDASADCNGVHGLKARRACRAPDRHAAVTVQFGD